MILALAGLALAGSVMTAEAADVNSQGEKGNGVRRISTTPWQGEEPLKLTDTWDKTFPKSDKVDHSKVTFHNRYGITLAADLYMPKNRKGKMAALAVAGPFGAVKEQAAGLYAQKLAEMGFLTMAFDHPLSAKAAAESEMWPVRTSIRKISRQRWIISPAATM